MIKNIASDIGLPVNTSLFDIILHSDLVIKVVLLILLLSSIYSWTIVFQKTFLIRKQVKRAGVFEKQLWAGKPIETLYKEANDHPDHSIDRIFISAIKSLKEESRLIDNNSSSHNMKDNIYQSMNIEYDKTIAALEKDIGSLATISSSSPFIGLFGTVWGIMKSFQNIAAFHSTSLAVVAPSIAEALLATAVGLAVAIPSSIFYNKLTLSVTNFSSRLNTFIKEFGLLLTKDVR